MEMGCGCCTWKDLGVWIRNLWFIDVVTVKEGHFRPPHVANLNCSLLAYIPIHLAMFSSHLYFESARARTLTGLAGVRSLSPQ